MVFHSFNYGFFLSLKNKARRESSVSTAVIVRDLPDEQFFLLLFFSVCCMQSLVGCTFISGRASNLKTCSLLLSLLFFEGIFHLLGLFLSDSFKSNIGLTAHAVPPTYLPTIAHAPTPLRKYFHYYQCFFLYKE